MNKKQIKILKTLLGQDILHTLEKAELYNPMTNTTSDPHEIEISLQIVPRTIMSFLYKHLKPMKANDQLDLELPFVDQARMNINKLSNDVYSGEIYKENKVVYRFKYRPLPSLGLIILSTFELYDVEDLDKIPEHEDKQKENDLMNIINERFQLQSLIKEVIDENMKERDAIQMLLLERVKEAITPKDEFSMNEKKLKLKEFLESRRKTTLNESAIEKHDLDCLDCTGNLYKTGDKHITCCLCFGEFYNKSIPFKKKEGKVEFKFPKNFDVENIEMLLDTIKNNKK